MVILRADSQQRKTIKTGNRVGRYDLQYLKFLGQLAARRVRLFVTYCNPPSNDPQIYVIITLVQ